MKNLLSFLFIPLAFSQLVRAEPGAGGGGGAPGVTTDIAYKGSSESPYEAQRCKLDIYLPSEPRKGFATLLWFHGGGLKGGNNKGDRALASSLARGGIAVVSADYRLSPEAKYPAYLQDAAAAFAWTHAHIGEYGGDSSRIYVGGHSAGGYLTLMIGLDPSYLGAFQLAPSAIAGLVPVSGQTMTHYTVREERGIGQFSITADEAAPVHYGGKETPPMLVLYADHDMAARAEENAYFVAVMKGAGNKRVRGQQIQDRTHGSIAGHIADADDPARQAILDFINKSSTVAPIKAEK